MPDNKISRTWCEFIIAELVYLALATLGLVSIWYDVSVPRERYISTYINRWIHWEPATAFLSGALTILVTWIIHKAWLIKFRYALAIMIFGFCLGHLFWSQPKP